MNKPFLEIVVYVLAIYGVWALISSVMRSIHQRVHKANHGTKLVLMVKNQEDTIEGIVRNIFLNDIPGNLMACERVTVLDMSSSDETYNILLKLKKDYQGLNVLSMKEKDAIFGGYDDMDSGMRIQPKTWSS